MIKTQYEKSATPKSIVKQLNKSWRELLTANPVSEEDCAAFEESFAKAHRDVYVAYPLVCRYMIYMRMYNPKILLKWLKTISPDKWKDENIYFDDQSEYITALRYGFGKHRERGKYKEEVRKLIIEEFEEYKLSVRKAEEAFNENERRRKENLRDNLRAWAVSHREAELQCMIPHAQNPIQTETDMVCDLSSAIDTD